MARPSTDDLQIYLDTHFGGKVGIGNDNPDEKLDVAGNAFKEWHNFDIINVIRNLYGYV